MKKTTNFFKNYWPLLGYVLISVIFLFPILRQQGIPFKYDWNWPLFEMKEFWKYLFDSGSLGLFSAPGKYAILILGLPDLVKLPPSLALKLFLLTIHVVAGYGFYLFISKRTNSPLRQGFAEQAKLIAFFAGLAYAFSPYIFIRTITGFIYSLISYALFPWIVGLYLKEKKPILDFILLGFLLALSWSQLQAGFLITFYLFILSVILAFQGKFKKEFGNFILTIASFLGFSLLWILLLFKGHNQGLVFTGTEVSTLKYIANLPHSLRNTLMLSDHIITRDFFYPYARTLILTLSFAAIYLIAAFSFLDKKNRPIVITSILTTLAVLPFSIGPTGIFSHFYSFIYNHFSYIAFFRETYHLEFIIAFNLLLLFAFGSSQIFSYFYRLGRFWLIFFALFFSLVSVIISPYFGLNYVGYFHLQQIPDEYSQVNEFFKENKQFCTKAYYPPNLGFIYFADDLSPDAVNSDSIASAFGLPYLTDGSSVLNAASKEMFFRNRLTSLFLEENDNGEVAALMREGGVDCLVVRTDLYSKFWRVSNIWRDSSEEVRKKWMNFDMLSLARAKKGLKLSKQIGDKIFIFKISNDKIRMTNDEKIPNDLINNEIIQQFNNTAIYLSIASWATDFDYYREGWSRGRYAFWRKKIFADLEQDFIYTIKPDAVLEGKIDQDGEYDLQVRYLTGGTPGNFQFSIFNFQTTIVKNPGEEKFVVKNLGKVNVEKGDKLEIKNISGENAIADIILVPSD